MICLAAPMHRFQQCTGFLIPIQASPVSSLLTINYLRTSLVNYCTVQRTIVQHVTSSTFQSAKVYGSVQKKFALTGSTPTRLKITMLSLSRLREEKRLPPILSQKNWEERSEKLVFTSTSCVCVISKIGLRPMVSIA